MEPTSFLSAAKPSPLYLPALGTILKGHNLWVLHQAYFLALLEEKLLLSPFCKCYNMVCMVVACVYEFLRQRRSLHGNPQDYLCPSSNKSIWGRVVFRYVCKCISYVNYQLRLYLPYRPVY